MEQYTSVSSPGIKIATAWGGVGVASAAEKAVAATPLATWNEIAALVASVLAALYTIMLIGEWLWKKVGRPFAEKRGWAQKLYRRRDDRKDES